MGYYKKNKKASGWDNWSQTYFPGLPKWQHVANNNTYKAVSKKLAEDGTIVVPCLNKAFNKNGEEINVPTT